ncbi:MAG: hypothetical protein UX81_C0039G0002 [Parcubacteria group bacterium GW2011_GWA2_47_12]|nr:MAG: hypothetical protein UX81_C0039G0002 [Parcubacteria group bacterium GW2011_GWA2_47_12]
MREHFSIQESLKFGWKAVGRNFFLLPSLLFVLILLNVGEKFLPILLPDHVFLLFLIFAIIFVLKVFVWLIVLQVALDLADQTSPSLERALQRWRLFLPFILASIVTFLAILAGLVLLIVPGIIAAVAFIFFPFVILDMRSGPLASLRESWRITKGNRMKLFGFLIILGLITIAGFLFFVIGVLFTASLSLVAYAHAYRTLRGNAKNENSSFSSTPGSTPFPSVPNVSSETPMVSLPPERRTL